MTSKLKKPVVEEDDEPIWLSKLENRRVKRALHGGKLGHEQAAGALCNNCGNYKKEENHLYEFKFKKTTNF